VIILQLDKNNMNPIYVQIAESIENDILDGMLQEDEHAYSQYQISKLLGINPATAAKGINLLVQKGYLYKVRGMGMYVSKGARKQILSERKKSFSSTLVKELILEAKKLEITQQELLDMIKKEYTKE
jgi:DNA-binding transcriptional regulator YhcF (GntR family)